MIATVRRRRLILFVIFFTALYFAAQSAHAFKMNIDPPRVVISSDQGKEHSGYISVLNYHEDSLIHVKVYQRDIVYLPDGSNDFLPEGTTPWSVSDWLKVGPTEFDIPAGEEMKVRYIVNVPEDTRGGRYGVVFFEVSPPLEELEGKTGAAVNIRLGSIILVTVNGTEEYLAEFKDLSVGKAERDGTFDIFCTIRNNGNVLIRPNGPVKIIDTSSKTEVAELVLNQSKSGILPDTSRQFQVTYEGARLPPGNYVVQAILDYGGEDYLGGQSDFQIK